MSAMVRIVICGVLLLSIINCTPANNIDEPITPQLVGKVFRFSDVQTMPHTIIDRGQVVLIEHDKMDSLAEAINQEHQIALAEFPEKWAFPLTAKVRDEIQITVSAIQTNGHYQASISTGKYVICLANVSRWSLPSADDTIQVMGCTFVDIDKLPFHLDLAYGEFGTLHLSPST